MQAAFHSQPNGVCLATVGGAVSYERTAFLSSSGNDGTAVLNDPDLPFLTNDAAVDALAVSYAGQTTTLRYLSNNTSALAASANLNTLLAAGLTMRSHDASVWTLSGTLSFGDAAGASLTLAKVVLSTLTKAPHTGLTAESAGTITGDADSVITDLTISADATPTGTGADGSSGGTLTGAAGSNGADGDYPYGGGAGESVNASGTTGETGETGNRAWNVTLAGNFTVSFLTGTGGQGGTGGNGGQGGNATGGNGGNGGNATHPTDPVDGGAAGPGGDGTSYGGEGGIGGTGGTGSTVTKGASVTITVSTITGGTGGGGGTGGLTGAANAGVQGTPGSGINGGNSGSSAAAGNAYSGAGGNGASGSAGTNGSIV